MQPKTILRTVASILAAGACGGSAHGQSTDALLNKLVQKGLLTPQEADELKKEGKEDAKTTVIKGFGMPDWVTSVKFYGDFRGRYEHFYADNSANTDRDRYRYRVRLGTTISMKDDF